MHVGSGGRQYLHHTGGMLSFSSSFHVDVASGVGAFASTTLTAFADLPAAAAHPVRGRCADQRLGGQAAPRAAAARRALRARASLCRTLLRARAALSKSGPATPLTIVADGKSAPLQPLGGELFRTTHPSFRAFDLMFERARNLVVSAAFGSKSFVRSGIGCIRCRHRTPFWRSSPGAMSTTNPWFGTVTIVERGGRLWIGTETPYDAHRRTILAGRRRELVAGTRLVRRFHRRPAADPHLSPAVRLSRADI